MERWEEIFEEFEGKADYDVPDHSGGIIIDYRGALGEACKRIAELEAEVERERARRERGLSAAAKCRLYNNAMYAWLDGYQEGRGDEYACSESYAYEQWLKSECYREWADDEPNTD